MKLDLDLIPASSWFNNVRAAVSQKQWNIIRSKVLSKAYNLCEICGADDSKNPLECHEKWEYDKEFYIQKLTGMISLCKDCHMVKHFGLAEIQGKRNKALNHLMKINKISKLEAEKYVAEQFVQWAKRSKRKWELDISHLKEYGINIEKLREENG